MYHRFGEGAYPSTNIRLEQFEAHLAELQSGPYTVLPLPEIVSALVEGRPLPPRTVGITIDDAHASLLREGWPRLKAAGLPFTLFVASEPVEKGLPDYMSWAEIAALADEPGVDIGSQSHSHPHMADLSAAQVADEIARSQALFTEHLGRAPSLFAYPYGEASSATMAAIEAAGFEVAFGQHSGVVGVTEPRFYLPRFALNESYGDPERVRLALSARALAVGELTPEDPYLGPGADNPPLFGFTVLEQAGPALARLEHMACYASHLGQVERQLIGPRVEVRLATPFPSGRGRINCTLPDGRGGWYWLGRQFVIP
ncbi:polysaccharide deacetylase family protein [Roseospirillum parvum]|nr:polysaccharide deacetylase family protein [Roseospirillum parvum]